jgi:hypothetical protein
MDPLCDNPTSDLCTRGGHITGKYGKTFDPFRPSPPQPATANEEAFLLAEICHACLLAEAFSGVFSGKKPLSTARSLTIPLNPYAVLTDRTESSVQKNMDDNDSGAIKQMLRCIRN